MSRTNGYQENAAGPSQSQLPPLAALNGGYGPRETISPRFEVLSSSTERRRTRGTHDTSSRRKHRRTSEKHSAPSDTSQRELLRLVLEQEAEADNLKKALQTTLQQLEEEAQKVVEYERGNREATERFRQINDSRLAAEQQALQASQQLHLYEFQLQSAQREIQTAQEAQRLLERQKEEAEELAARARARARKLHQRQIVMQAKEEGRRMGFEAGIKQAQDELVITATARRAVAQGRLGSSPRQKEKQQRTSRSATPPPQSPVEEYQDEGPQREDEDPLAEYRFEDTQDFDAYGDSETLRSSVMARTRTFPEHNAQSSTRDSPMRASASLPQPSTSQRPDASPGLQVFSLPIPAPEDIPEHISGHPNHRPSGWVTAQEHRVLNGSQTSHATSQRDAAPAPVQLPVQGVHFTPQNPPFQDPTMQRPPGPATFPAPILIAPYGERPPLKSSGSAKKILRFPSMAKNKAQSWYRSLSLRKKRKPVIDPIEEELPTPIGDGHPPSDKSSGQELYRFQPEAPKSWYQDARPSSEVKSQKSQNNLLKAHSRAVSMDDRANDGVSRASTRFSQLDMISSAPNRFQNQNDGNSISGRSGLSKKLVQKLSIITEDSHSKGAPSQPDQYQNQGSNPFTILPNSETHRHHRRRPAGLNMPPPPGFDPDDPFIQGNYHLFPNGIPNGGPPLLTSDSLSGRTSEINIDIQPATAAFRPPTAGIPPFSGNHLTPNYVYQPPAPLRTPRRDPAPMNWDPVTPSNASQKSRQSNQSRVHRPTQSYDDHGPNAYLDNQSVRSKQPRRPASTMGHGGGQESYPPDTQRLMGIPSQPPPRPSSRSSRAPEPAYQYAPRPASVRSSASKNHPAQGSDAQLLGLDGQAIRRVGSRSSMHSRYDPSTYVDPAFYNPDGSADPAALHIQQRPTSRASSMGLEYI